MPRCSGLRFIRRIVEDGKDRGRWRRCRDPAPARRRETELGRPIADKKTVTRNVCLGRRSGLPLEVGCSRCPVRTLETSRGLLQESDSISIAYEFRTKSAKSSRFGEKTGGENEFQAAARQSQSSGSRTKGRRYCASKHVHEPPENVGLGRPGGGSSLRTYGTLSRNLPLNSRQNLGLRDDQSLNRDCLAHELGKSRRTPEH